MTASVPTPPAGMQGSPGPLLKIVRDQRIAFLIVGGANTLIGLLWFVVGEATVGKLWGYLASLAFAHVLSVICAFFLYRNFVFRVKGHLLRDLGRFELVYLVSISVNFVLLPILVQFAHLQPVVAQCLIVVVTTLISYFGHRGFSFRRPAEAATADTVPVDPEDPPA